jgi:hypothetical protein
MKKIILLFVISFILQKSFAQVDAMLVYENEYSDNIATGKVTTTIYESKGKARIESTNAQTKSSFGAPVTKDQNAIIFDFSTQKETHLNAKMNMAVSTAFTAVTMEQQMKTLGTDHTVQNLGAEKVGNYNCTHYAITTTNSKNKNMPPAKKEVWITNDLGNANIFFVGQYLYYPLGCDAAKKITDAGATGIVVKWQVEDPVSKKPNICTLVSYQKKSLPASTFSPPAGYTVMQR